MTRDQFSVICPTFALTAGCVSFRAPHLLEHPLGRASSTPTGDPNNVSRIGVTGPKVNRSGDREHIAAYRAQLLFWP